MYSYNLLNKILDSIRWSLKKIIAIGIKSHRKLSSRIDCKNEQYERLLKYEWFLETYEFHLRDVWLLLEKKKNNWALNGNWYKS